MAADSDTFICTQCSVESPISSSVTLETDAVEDYLVGQVIGEPVLGGLHHVYDLAA